MEFCIYRNTFLREKCPPLLAYFAFFPIMVKSFSLRLTKSATLTNMKRFVGNVNYLFICVCSVKLWEIGAVESPNIGNINAKHN